MKPDSTDNTNAADPLGFVTLDEFPEGAAEFTDEVSRRRFLTLMGASLALAGAAGCNIRPAPQRHILPYTTQPDELTPGVPLFFATCFPFNGYGQGVLVRSNDGRPTKVEGNPDHPSSLGGTSIHGQASVLDLYDPDRSRIVTHRGIPASYEQSLVAIRNKLFNGTNRRDGVRLRILTETVTSPTFAEQMKQLLGVFAQKDYEAKWVQYDPISNENARAGIAKAFGKPLNVTYDFNKADVVVSLDSDFLTSGAGQVRYSRDFCDRRKIRVEGKNSAEIIAGRIPGQQFKDGVQADQLNRLYAVETMPTNTGAIADHRIGLTSSQIEAFARALAAEIVPGATAAGTLPDAAKAWLKPLADDLKKPERKGKVVIVAGDHLPPAVHTLAMAINSQLGAIGQTVHLTEPIEATVPGRMIDLKTLVGEMNAKQVDVLLIFGNANPAYSAPADINFADAIKNVGLSFHLGLHQDETAVLCEWHVPAAHYLETWGDIRGHDGTASIQQPLIAPLHGGKAEIEVLSALLRPNEAGVPPAQRTPLEIVQGTWIAWFKSQKRTGPFEIFWQEAVRKGVIEGSKPAPAKAEVAKNWSEGLADPTAAPAGDFEVYFRPDPTLFDGRFANNGWLQELPKPLTKISWDNAAYVSEKTAEKLGFKKSFRWTAGEHGRAEVNVIEIEVNGKKVTAPVWMLPGHADGAITVHLGSGRTRAGTHVGNIEGSANLNTDGEQVRGFNAYKIRFSNNLWSAPAKITQTNKTYFLACTQGHWSMVERDPIGGGLLDRKPVRQAPVSEYLRNPKFAKIPPMAIGETELIVENVPQPVKPGAHVPTAGGGVHHELGPAGDDHHARIYPLNMYKPAENLTPDLRDSQRRRWAMAIDLSACTGCSACVVACQSENNIPIVGKEQVTKGREMYWISIDRYYAGTQHNPDAMHTYFQPRACVQCENAPCEIVCPVGATVHSADGLNDMTYNRCVGTRYCSNNCPYKVRRFNFLSFNAVYSWDTDTIKLGRNPDVTVRSRGVMEKCTFCVQRIRYAEIVAEREFRPIRDGEILTACQSACPSGAIVFGDINDAAAVVSKWKNEPTNYGLLAELNTRPRLTYLAIVRNPNPAMPKS